MIDRYARYCFLTTVCVVGLMSRATAASANYCITHQTLNAACNQPLLYTSLSFMAGADEFIVAEKGEDGSYHLRPAAHDVYLQRKHESDGTVSIKVYRIYGESHYREQYARLSATRSGMGMLLAGVAALGALALPRFQEPAVALSVQAANDAPNAHTTHKAALSIDILEVVRRGCSYLVPPPLLCSGIAAACGLYCARVKREQHCASWTSFITQCWRSYRWSSGIVERPDMRAVFNNACQQKFGSHVTMREKFYIVEHVALGALLTQHCNAKKKQCIICSSHHDTSYMLCWINNNNRNDPEVFTLVDDVAYERVQRVSIVNPFFQ